MLPPFVVLLLKVCITRSFLVDFIEIDLRDHLASGELKETQNLCGLLNNEDVGTP
jgi:hypothetical protein